MKKKLEKSFRYFANWYMHRFDRFDGSFHPSKKYKILDSPKYDQDCIPKINVDEAGNFRIEFGKGHTFNNGHVEVNYNNTIYSSLINSPNPLEIINSKKNEETSVLGTGQNYTQTWNIPNTEIIFETTIIEIKESQFIQFEINFPKKLENISTGSIAEISIGFPVFTNQSPNERMLTFKDKDFSPPLSIIEEYSAAPVCLFDDNKNAVLISALNHFTTNVIVADSHKSNPSRSFKDASFKLGLSGKVEHIPKDYKIHFIMVFKKGINNIFNLWGDLLHKYYNIQERSLDPYENLMNSHLGYFTDNGSYYYYNPIPGKTYDETLLEVEKYYSETEPLPFNYYHLDSWWYPKSRSQNKFTKFMTKLSGGGRAGGCVTWDQLDSVWDMNLDDLSKKLNDKPFTAHARWYDESSPYLDKYPFIKENGWIMPTTLEFWQKLMDTAKKYNIFIFEQDWMYTMNHHFSHLQEEIGADEKWLKHMSVAAKEKNIHIQYCMATPAQWMESIKFPNVINFRTTRDYHSYMNIEQAIPQFTQNALLVRALGKIPFLDVFFASYKQKDYFFQEHWPEIKALLNVLGTGPVAPGDKIGELEPDLISRICRKDGLILKPDRPLTAVDTMYISHKTHYIASTESNHNGMQWYYVLNFNLWPKEVSDPKYCLKEIDIDIKGSFIEFNWFDRKTKKVDTNTVLDFDWKKKEYDYCIYAPLLPNGVAFIGDISKYATISRKQITNLKWMENSLEFEIDYALGDEVCLWIWLPKEPNNEMVINDTKGKWIEDTNIMEFHITFEKTGRTHCTLDIKF